MYILYLANVERNNHLDDGWWWMMMDDAATTFEQNSLTGHQPMTSLGIKGGIACIHCDLWPTLALTISKWLILSSKSWGQQWNTKNIRVSKSIASCRCSGYLQNQKPFDIPTHGWWICTEKLPNPKCSLIWICSPPVPKSFPTKKKLKSRVQMFHQFIQISCCLQKGHLSQSVSQPEPPGQNTTEVAIALLTSVRPGKKGKKQWKWWEIQWVM